MSPVHLAGRRAPTGRFNRTILGGIVAIAAVAAVACAGSESTGPNLGNGYVVVVAITPPGTSLAIGDTLTFVASMYDIHEQIITTDTVVWKSTAPSIATISDSGFVTAVAAGSTSVVATDGLVADTVTLTVTPPTTHPLSGISALTSGFSHVCAIGSSGTAYCWGSNAHSQLGSATATISPLPLAITGAPAWSQITAGYSHTCGLTASGAAYCWGDNAAGELGAGTTVTSSVAPVAVAGGLTFAALSAGYSHTCGVTTAGAAYCWGADESGELGNGAAGASSNVPVAVSGGLTFASISTGGVSSCGVTTAGAGYCWGSNTNGVLGDDSTTDNAAPVAVAGGLTLASISTGVYHACALTTSGAAYCWGSGGNGQLGTGGTSVNADSPQLVSGGLTFASITTGEMSTCAVTTSGAAYCWGDGTFGVLGNGSTQQATTPQLVSGGQTFSSLSAGISFHVCGLTTAGAVFCWGYNNNGELGIASAGGYSSTPQQVVIPND